MRNSNFWRNKLISFVLTPCGLGATAFAFLLPASAQALIGGAPTSNAYEVYIGTCTGTMIAPNVILTAGHCVHGRTEDGSLSQLRKRGSEIEIQSYDGADSTGFKRLFRTRVLGTVAHPLWVAAIQAAPHENADLAGDVENVADVGVIILEQRLPLQNVALPGVQLLESGRYDQTELLLFGAGCQVRGDNRTNGTLKTSIQPILKSTSSKVLLGTSERLTHHPAGICKRDSGGGIFMLNLDGTSPSEPVQIAVNSILAGTEADALRPEAMNFFVSRIDRPEVLSWLQQIVRVAPSRAPSTAVEVPQ